MATHLQKDHNNMAGLLNIWLALTDKRDSFVFSEKTKEVSGITFKVGAGWFKVPILKNKASFEFEEVRNNGGKYYSFDLEVDFSKIRNEINKELSRISESLVMVGIQDQNEQFWVAASEDSGLLLKYKGSFGESPAGYNHYKLKISGATELPLLKAEEVLFNA